MENFKSLYILKQIIKFIQKKKYLEIIVHNKNLQKKLNISIDTYIKLYNQIEIEIIPDISELDEDDVTNKFILINSECDKPFFHIYFDESHEEVKRNYLNKEDKISKIKVLIDMEVKSLKYLFYCSSAKEIKFIKYNRNDSSDTDYSYMFSGCKNLINLDISKIKTNNVKNMSYMFYNCSSLKNLNLSNFKTDQVTDITKMFSGCRSLETLDLSSFKTDNINNMNYAFHDCISLKELNISNFVFNNSTNVEYLFSNCSKKLKKDIKKKFKNINANAFFNYNGEGLTDYYYLLASSDDSKDSIELS